MSGAEIRLKRAYDDAADNDGTRILVDRVWPRGVSKEKARLDDWLKDVAPSTELRKWFGHDPDKWDEFSKRYRAELEDDDHAEAMDNLRSVYQDVGRLTLVFAAKDEEHNQAVVLKHVLQGG
ncbi:MAG TPA: DUF488 domain-containing protein [Salinisphaeraceae bacterium]|nr:DUF488 domain-containing protein [Salinisphaeraceae bacterium]